MTRWRLDVWSWFSYDCTEEEALGNLVVDLCEADCMQPVYDKIPGGRLESKVRAAVTSTLDKTVGLAVGAAWKGIVGAAEKGKDDIEDKARDCIGPVFDKQAELEQKVSKLIVGVIAPPLEDITRPIMTPVCTVLMAPLAAAFKELCFSFYDKMSAIIADGITEADLSKFVREIRCVSWAVVCRVVVVVVAPAVVDDAENACVPLLGPWWCHTVLASQVLVGPHATSAGASVQGASHGLGGSEARNGTRHVQHRHQPRRHPGLL